MEILGSRVRSVVDHPIRDRIFDKGGEIRLGARTCPEAVLAELMLLPDTTKFQHYLESFYLHIFDYIISPLKLLLLVLQLFLSCTILNTTPREYEQFKLRVDIPVSSRTIKFLSTWIKRRENDFILGDSALFEIVASFSKHLKQARNMKAPNSKLVEMVQLVSYLKDKLRNMHMISNSEIRIPDAHIGSSQSPLSVLGTPTTGNKVSLKALLKECTPMELAEVLMYIDIRQYLQFGPYELWAKRAEQAKLLKQSSSPLVQYLDRFNSFPIFLVHQVLTIDDVQERVRLVYKYIQTYFILTTNDEFISLESSYLIALTLHHVALRRLTSTFSLLSFTLSPTEKAIIDSPPDLKKEHQQNLQYLSSLKEDLAFVPATSVFLQVISKHHERTSTANPDRTINLQKLHFLSTTTNHYLAARQSPSLLSFIQSREYLSTSRLCRLLDRGYIRPLCRELNSTSLDSIDTEKKIYTLARSKG